MDNLRRFSVAPRPHVSLITSENSLWEPLVEKFLLGSFSVDVYAEGPIRKQKRYGVDSRRLTICKPTDMQKEPADYVLAVMVNKPEEVFDKNYLLSVKNLIVFTARLAKKFSAKCLFIFPFVQDAQAHRLLSAWLRELLDDDKLFAGVVYVGEAVPEQEPLFGNGGFSRILRAFFLDRIISPQVGEKYLYPVKMNDLAEEIIRLLFSLKAFSTETAVISKPLKVADLLLDLKRTNQPARVVKLVGGLGTKTADAKEFIYKNFDHERLIVGLKRTFLVRGTADNDKKPPRPRAEGGARKKLLSGLLARLRGARPPSVTRPAYFNNFRSYIAKTSRIRLKLFSSVAGIIITLFVVTPWILVAVSCLTLGVAMREFAGGSASLVSGALTLSFSTGSAAFAYGEILSPLPILGGGYQKVSGAAGLLVRASRVGSAALSLRKEAQNFLRQAVEKNSEYDPGGYSEKIYLGLDSLYNELGFLEGESNGDYGVVGVLAKRTIGVASIRGKRQKILSLKALSKELPGVLGKGRPRTYLVLFQDNSILRPTGGSLESFAILTFSDGKLVESEFYSSSFTDQRLKGFVAPPEPIRKYFGEELWGLKYSNWDPDFTVSASKAEWFIDKELDRSFDGVVAVDTDFLASWARQVKNPQLYNLGTGTTTQDLFRKAWQDRRRGGGSDDLGLEVASSLFDGLSRTTEKQSAGLLEKLLRNLDERHVQIFLHNVAAQRALSNLRWNGEMYQESCEDNCYPDFVGVVEASTNNSFPGNLLKKEADLNISLEEGVIKRRLILFMDNPQGQSAGEYAGYIRVIVPGDSGFGPVQVVGGPENQLISPEVFGIRGHKEAGVFIKLPPGETRALAFSWESGANVNFDKEGAYTFFLRKQAGISEYPVEIRFKFPEKVDVSAEPGFSLTDVGGVGYNTLLSRDFVSRVFW